jgi:hypothetical protein
MRFKQALMRWYPLLLICSISLFLEMAVIRWIAAEVRLFSYFKNLALLAALVTSAAPAQGQELLLRSSFLAPSSGHDFYSWLDDTSNYLSTYVIVPDFPVRFAAAGSVFYGMPTLLALCYSAWKAVRNRHQTELESEHRRGTGVLKQRRVSISGMGLLSAAIAIPTALLVTLGIFFRSYFVEPDDSMLQIVNFLNTQTKPGSLIETYETELFFLLERPYHYPPDPVQDQHVRSNYLSRNTVVDYDPLSADPDYLVVGQNWQLEHFALCWRTLAMRYTNGSARAVSGCQTRFPRPLATARACRSGWSPLWHDAIGS